MTIAALQKFFVFGNVARIRIDCTAVHCKVGVVFKNVAFVAVVAEFAAATGCVLLALRRLCQSLRAVRSMLLSNMVGAVGSILKDTLGGGTVSLSTIGDSSLRSGAGTVSTIGDTTLSGGAVSGSGSLLEICHSGCLV